MHGFPRHQHSQAVPDSRPSQSSGVVTCPVSLRDPPLRPCLCQGVCSDSLDEGEVSADLVIEGWPKGGSIRARCLLESTSSSHRCCIGLGLAHASLKAVGPASSATGVRMG